MTAVSTRISEDSGFPGIASAGWLAALLFVCGTVHVPSAVLAQVERHGTTDSTGFVLPPDPAELPPDLIMYGKVMAMTPLATGGLCPADTRCILGSGGGIGGEIQRRWPTGLGVSLGYGLGFLDGGGLYEIGVLQTIRAGAVYAFLMSNRAHPFVAAHVVGASYGESFAVETVGGGAELSGGVEWEFTAAISIYASVSLSMFFFSEFNTAGDGVRRGTGVTPVPVVSLSAGLAILRLR